MATKFCRQIVISQYDNVITYRNILLYGDPNLNDNDNKQIFLSVQKYILNTKRFQANR